MSNLVIFDMDDTLVGTHDLIGASFEHAVAKYSHLKLEEVDVETISGYTLSMMLSRKVPSNCLEEALDSYHEYFRDHFDTTAVIYPSLKETVAQLCETVNLAVLTGANRKWTEITLRESGLSDFFPVVLTSDEVKIPKPDPAGLVAIMRKFRISTEDTTYVGDEAKDIRTSRNASVHAAGALWGSWEKERLKSIEPDLVLENPVDLLRIIR